jgi:hypothetical protein
MHHVKDEEKEDDKEEENDDDDDDDDYEVKEDIAFITKTIPKLSKKKKQGNRKLSNFKKDGHKEESCTEALRC